MSTAAIVVTFNRLALLQNCLAAVRGQSRPPELLVVVDNGSTDGTKEWLATQGGLVVLKLDNEGSAGGFCAGLRDAHSRGATHFWLMDDDTIPQIRALESLLQSVENESYGFACSLALWKDATPHFMNNPQLASGVEWYHTILDQRRIPVRSASYVSLLIRREAIEQCGLPARNMFLWYDDAEFTTRIALKFPSFVILDSLVLHDTPQNTYVDLKFLDENNWQKFRWGIRNMVAFNRIYSPSLGGYLIFLIRVLVSLVRRFPKLPPIISLSLLKAYVAGIFFKPYFEKLIIKKHD